MYQDLKDKLFAEVGSQFEFTNMKFNEEFQGAFTRAISLNPQAHNSLIEAEIRAILINILNNYSDSQAKTKGGRIGRFFAKVVAFFLPFIKFKK